jgi:hypothetical protein
MPEVSRFYGIIIRLYHRDHPPTHFVWRFARISHPRLALGLLLRILRVA